MAKASPEWMSTYGLLTVRRLLERFQVLLSPDEITKIVKDESSDYHYLLAVPLKNVYCGIIYEQCMDYQLYAQKMIIDYKLANKEAKPVDGEEQQASNMDLSVSETIDDLKALIEELKALKEQHYACIAESQAFLLEASSNGQTFKTSNEILLFNERAEEGIFALKTMRSRFRELILSLTELLLIIPEYFLDPVKLKKHQEGLSFDSELKEVELFNPSAPPQSEERA